MSNEEIKEYLKKEIQDLEKQEDEEWFDEKKINHLLGQIFALSKLEKLINEP